MIVGLPTNIKTAWYVSKRFLTATEVSVALRPFFFAVHPDRYAQHPEIRNQNEKSLQIFNGYISDLFPVSPSLKPTKVSFSVVDKKGNSKFRCIQIHLSGTDPVKIVRDALESCQLNTTELLLKNKSGVLNSTLGYTTSNDNEDLLSNYLKRKKKTASNNLHEHLTVQRDEAVRRSKNASMFFVSLNEEIIDLKDRTGLKDIVWGSDWTETHMRRCISNVHKFLDQANQETKNVVSQTFLNNVLRFGHSSFTCCDGSIQLGADHSLEQWEQAFLKHQVRRSQLSALRKAKDQLSSILGGANVLLPHHKGLSRTLNQIQTLIMRIWRHEALLSRLANGGSGNMVEVVSSYHVLSIGSDGRIFIPCNVDIASLVVFLEENGEKAAEVNHKMQAIVNELEYLKEECIQVLKLKSLKWDNAFSPDVLLECIYRLMNSTDEIQKMIRGLNLHISKNPAIHITNDGTVSIPINWT